MRTATAAALMVVAVGAMTSAVVWARMQVAADDTPVILPPQADHAPQPGWLHLRAAVPSNRGQD